MLLIPIATKERMEKDVIWEALSAKKKVRVFVGLLRDLKRLPDELAIKLEHRYPALCFGEVSLGKNGARH